MTQIQQLSQRSIQHRDCKSHLAIPLLVDDAPAVALLASI
jgi:hypothetical protein